MEWSGHPFWRITARKNKKKSPNFTRVTINYNKSKNSKSFKSEVREWPTIIGTYRFSRFEGYPFQNSGARWNVRITTNLQPWSQPCAARWGEIGESGYRALTSRAARSSRYRRQPHINLSVGARVPSLKRRVLVMKIRTLVCLCVIDFFFDEARILKGAFGSEIHE